MSAEECQSTSSFDSTDSGNRLKKKKNKVTFSESTDTRTFAAAPRGYDQGDSSGDGTPADERPGNATVRWVNGGSRPPLEPRGPDSDYSAATPRIYRPVPQPAALRDRHPELAAAGPSPPPPELPTPPNGGEARRIARDACIVNDYVRLKEVLRSIDADELKSALQRRLDERNARLVVALTLLLPRQCFPSRTRHCVKCHRSYEEGESATVAERRAAPAGAWGEFERARNSRAFEPVSPPASRVRRMACEHESSPDPAALFAGGCKSCAEMGCLTQFM